MLIATVFMTQRILNMRSEGQWGVRNVAPTKEFKLEYPKVLMDDPTVYNVLEVRGVVLPADARVVGDDFIRLQRRFLVVSGDAWTLYEKED